MGGADERTVDFTFAYVGKHLPEVIGAFRTMQLTLSEAARPYYGRRFEDLSTEDALTLIERWVHHPVLGKVVRLLGVIYRFTHFDRPDIRGSVRAKLKTIENVEQPRWLSQMVPARDLDSDEELECDIVVIGTGAGGAVVGKHLADQGYAVIFVEEGEHYRRNDFPGNLLSTVDQVYRSTLSIGNAPLYIPQGRLVGGSTAVNGGSSFRPPRWVTDRWCEELGSAEFSTEALDPYFERTEGILQVEPADVRYAGPPHVLFERGADALKWHRDVIRRNAPGCRGEGFCDHGCRTDARRSTNISYLPTALERGAMVIYGLKADKLLLDGDKARGIEGVALHPDRTPVRHPGGKPKRIKIKSRAVILAGGAIASPTFLLSQGLANSSGQVGRNLTVHPSGPTLGLFDEMIDTASFIPQADYSFEHLAQGILLLSAGGDGQMTAPLLPFVGRSLMDLMEQQKHMAGVGYLIADEARGRIRLSPGGRPLLFYSLTKKDVARAHQAITACAELLFAAGAREVYPGVLKPFRLRGRADLEAFKREKVGAGDLMMTSYHPLGSCKMSRNPKAGVVDLNHQAHDIPGLFIVDGSTVLGPLGVNPQITIMGLATRAAEKIGQLLAS